MQKAIYAEFMNHRVMLGRGLCSGLVSLCLFGVATAQADTSTDTATTSPTATSAPPTNRRPEPQLTTGMRVQGSDDQPVGTIVQLRPGAGGIQQVTLVVDGTKIPVLASSLSVDETGQGAISIMTKAQLLARDAATPGVR